MAGFAVDASVLIELFIGGSLAEEAATLLSQAADFGLQMYAPDAVYYEVAAGIRKHEIRSGFAEFEKSIAALADLDLRIVPSKEILFDAASIARRHRYSIYDSFYLAVAVLYGVPLVTLDRRLVNRNTSRNKPFQVIHISEFDALV